LIKKKTSIEIFKKFNKLRLKNCKNIYITSNLIKFSKIRIHKEDKLKIILNNLKKIMGKNYTIFAPSSTLNLCNTNLVFDLINTPSYKMGPLSEYIRKQNATRSLHPYWSVIGIGKNKNLLNNVSKHAYGFNSPWSYMRDFDFTQVNIGMHPSKAVTMIHHVETMVGVPYRYTKEFKHKIKIKNRIYTDNFYLSVLYKSTPIIKKKKLNEHFFAKLQEQGKLNYAKTSFGLEMWSFKMKDFFDVATKMLTQDIYCYLEKKPNLKSVHKN
jgi:aminoglycoside 3-N-acetyltransferase